MSVTVWEAKIELDIGLPDEVITEFRKKSKKNFGAVTGCYDYPPDAVIDGQSIYSCQDAPKAGYHVTVTIDGSQRNRFRKFLARFCEKHDLGLSSCNLEVLSGA